MIFTTAEKYIVITHDGQHKHSDRLLVLSYEDKQYLIRGIQSFGDKHIKNAGENYCAKLLTMLKLFSEGPMLYTGCTYHEVVTS
jgi:hypothetical protein